MQEARERLGRENSHKSMLPHCSRGFALSEQLVIFHLDSLSNRRTRLGGTVFTHDSNKLEILLHKCEIFAFLRTDSEHFYMGSHYLYSYSAFTCIFCFLVLIQIPKNTYPFR